MIRRFGLMLMVAWASTTRGADDPGKEGSIAGRVVDLQGRGVAGASVWGVHRLKEVGRTRADAEGRFRLGPLPEDNPVDVWFEGEGLARERREGVHVFGGLDQDLGDLALVPGTRIAGRLVDVDGRAIAGAKVGVEVYRRILGHTIDSSQAKWEVAGDAEGRFRTPPLPAGEGELIVDSPGKVRTRIGRRTTPGTPEIDLGEVRIEGEVPIRGVVVDRDGKPAPKVEVVVDYDWEHPALTDQDGRFALGGAGRDAKEIRLTSNDYFAPKPYPIAPDRLDLRLVVTKSYEILGSAVDAESGAPVEVDSVRLCMVTHEPDGTTSLRG